MVLSLESSYYIPGRKMKNQFFWLYSSLCKVNYTTELCVTRGNRLMKVKAGADEACRFRCTTALGCRRSL